MQGERGKKNKKNKISASDEAIWRKTWLQITEILRALKQVETAKQTKKTSLMMKFYKCHDCGSIFNSHIGLDYHKNESHSPQGESLC